MLLPVLNSENKLMKGIYIKELLELNEKTKEYKVSLTEEDAIQILETRSKVLKGYERIDLGINVTKRIIELFSLSLYVSKENYIEIIIEIQEMFYYLKNETNEKISDEELINTMYKYFETECGGSIYLLRGKMEQYAKKFRIEHMNDELFDEGRDIYERRHK